MKLGTWNLELGTSNWFFGWPAFLAVVSATQLLAAHRAHPDDYYLPGDCRFYAEAAKSLLADGDLDLLNQFFPGAPDLAAVLPQLEGTPGSYFALSAGGSLTLKQSPVLAVAAVPLLALFGEPGFLVFNVLAEDALLVGLVVLAGGGPAARGVILLGLVATPVWRYGYNFSPDFALCGLLVGGLLAARSARPGLAGLLAGLAVSLKLYAAAFLVPVPVLAVAAAGRRGRAAAGVVAGGLLGLAPGAGLNAWQFGSPLVTGYERQLAVTGGRVGLADHSSRFTVPPVRGFGDLVRDPGLGLWPTAPVWFLWPAAAGWLLSGRGRAPGGRAWVAAAVGVIGLNLLLFSTYAGAREGSAWVNRYLFPALLLGFALVAAGGRKFGHGSTRINTDQR